MYEGRIDQIGTPEEIITNPATDYVRKFTSDVSREKLLSVGSVMRPATTGTTGSGSIPSDAKLGDVAPQVLGVDGDHHVHDDAGLIVGVVDRTDLISALYGEQT